MPCARRRAEARRRGEDDGREARNILHAVAEGIGIDAGQRAFAHGGAHGLHPARAGIALQRVGELPAGGFRLAKGADGSFAQVREQGEEQRRGDARIGQRIMPAARREAEMARERIEREPAEAGKAEFGQQARIEHAVRGRGGKARQLALPRENREVEADIVADQNRIARIGLECGIGHGEGGRIRHISIAQAVNRGGGGRDRRARIDLDLEGVRLIRMAGHEAHRADLQQAGLCGVEPGCLGVEDHRIQRKQRIRGDQSRHGFMLLPSAPSGTPAGS